MVGVLSKYSQSVLPQRLVLTHLLTGEPINVGLGLKYETKVFAGRTRGGPIRSVY